MFNRNFILLVAILGSFLLAIQAVTMKDRIEEAREKAKSSMQNRIVNTQTKLNDFSSQTQTRLNDITTKTQNRMNEVLERMKQATQPKIAPVVWFEETGIQSL